MRMNHLIAFLLFPIISGCGEKVEPTQLPDLTINCSENAMGNLSAEPLLNGIGELIRYESKGLMISFEEKGETICEVRINPETDSPTFTAVEAMPFTADFHTNDVWINGESHALEKFEENLNRYVEAASQTHSMPHVLIGFGKDISLRKAAGYFTLLASHDRIHIRLKH